MFFRSNDIMIQEKEPICGDAVGTGYVYVVIFFLFPCVAVLHVGVMGARRRSGMSVWIYI